MNNHICPWWHGYFLANPLRKLFQDPFKILSPFINEGMHVIDIGSGMGYFSLPLAEMTDDKGKVICVDIQKQMLASLEKKAKQKKLFLRIETVLCNDNSLCIERWAGKIDFILAFAVVHEVMDKKDFFSQINKCLKNTTGKLLFAEPKGRVSKNDFSESIKIAEEAGLKFDYLININNAHSAILHNKNKII